MKHSFRLMAILALVCVQAFADQITLKDGSVINGKITEVFKGKLKITTAFAGALVIDNANIASMTTDAPVMVALPSGKQESKLATAADGSVTVGASQVKPSEITAVWQLGGIDPTLPKPRKWSYEAAFAITGKRGNTHKTTLGGGLSATLAGPEDKLKLYLNGKYAKENHEKNEEEIIGGLDFERQLFGSMHSLYFRSEAEHDKFENYKLYLTNTLGYGYYLLKTDDYQIRLRAGIAYTRKDYEDDKDTDDNIGMEFNYHHELKLHKFLGFQEFGKLVTDVTYLPTFEDWEKDYRITHETALDIPLGGSDIWTLRMGISHDYSNVVGEDKDHLDTSFFGRIVLKWD